MSSIFKKITNLLKLIFCSVSLASTNNALATNQELIICLGGDTEGRVAHTIELLKEKPDAQIWFSGGYMSPDVSEAKKMENWMKEQYPQYKDMQPILEEESLDTIGNAIFSKIMMDELKDKSYQNITLVTSDYHMKRAMYLFTHIFGDDFNITPSPAITPDSIKKVHTEHEKVALELSKIMFALARKGNVKDFYNLARITDPKFMKALEDPHNIEKIKEFKKQLLK